MTLEEYNLLEQELINSGLDNKSFLTSRGIKLHKYYYWKRCNQESEVQHFWQFGMQQFWEQSIHHFWEQECSNCPANLG